MRRLVPLVLALSAVAGLAQSQSTSNATAGSGSEPKNVRGGGTENFIPKWTSSQTLGNSVLFQAGSDLGVGTTTPEATLDVNSSEAIALQATTTSTDSVTWGVYGHARSTTGNAFGVGGDTGSTGYGAGVLGAAYATSGTAFGGFFSAASPDGLACSATLPHPLDTRLQSRARLKAPTAWQERSKRTLARVCFCWVNQVPTSPMSSRSTPVVMASSPVISRSTAL